MKFEIAHDLGKNAARRRIEKGLPALEKHIPGGGTVEASWIGEDVLDMKVLAMGQTVGVRIEVEDTLLRGEVAVPMMLSMMSGVIRDFIEKSSRLMLEKDGGTGRG
jgi:hypothetical protein